MAAYYLNSFGDYISEEALDAETEQLIQAEVLWELQKSGFRMGDAMASLYRVVKKFEDEYGPTR